MNKRIIITLGVGLFLLLGTLGAIKFAKGYRLNLKDGKLKGTGLLVANSFPKGAQVFINDKLTTATDDTLNLPPGDYKVKVVKDGFITWEKNLKLEKELVVQTNTHLFPAVPNLRGLTYAGALNITPSPDGQKIAFSVASASARLKNGLWILDLGGSALSFSQEPRQIAQTTKIFDFTNAFFVWSPNSKQILAFDETDTVLLDADRSNSAEELTDVSARLPLILADWQEQLEIKRKRQWEKLPQEMQKIASESAKNIYFSPDEEKMLYTCQAKTVIPENLISALPGSSTQPEARSLEPGKIYVYDLKEDKNFYIADAFEPEQEKDEEEIIRDFKQVQNQYTPLFVQNCQWFPTSQHLILTEKDKIIIVEYDGTNKATVYAGPFEQGFVYPWPDASKLLILTSLNPESQLPPNLYGIDLK